MKIFLIISISLVIGFSGNAKESQTSQISDAYLSDFVDPRIGSEGLGRVFVGPSMPFGMVKPSPDCTPSPNSGWLPMPERVDGFSQIHVSGTGGGPKYGNILIMPYSGRLDSTSHIDYRDTEEIRLGYYSTIFKNSRIRTEITTANRASAYRIHYPESASPALKIDAGFFLGESPMPNAREAQQFVGSEVRILSDTEVCGYSSIRGGWNNGKAYTVYFYLACDKPAISTSTWKGTEISNIKTQSDSGEKTGVLLRFSDDTRTLNVRIGISFVSELQAHENLINETFGKSFEDLHQNLLSAWNHLFSKIEIDAQTPQNYKRMFYTALYHTMLMPTDRSGENPLWKSEAPYYDDFYAIWDTYRSSLPLITLIDPGRERDIVNSLIDIYKHDGYMPDARSGNCNGRTQGGSNAEIVIADAFVKELDGIDYEQGLNAMLKDATVDPGANHEAEGRGGLNEYLKLGYIPHGIARAGNRTVEYSYCDYAVYLVAKGLGHTKLADKYLKQSENWKNLWRGDYEHDGTRGFIMPRDAKGNWLDSIPYGHSEKRKPTFQYTPVIFEGPWYKPWWDMFFYEASSWEYSLSIPHDVPGLIEKCGGEKAFETRLDKFFDNGYFNVNNEPSFLSPCLYHWIGKPDKSSDRISEIIRCHYSDTPAGLPGNDDSGAMSSWLAFHMIGLYPNAGQDYYLIHSPLIKSTAFDVGAGNKFIITAKNLSSTNRYIIRAELNGEDYPYSTILHSDIIKGGELKLIMGSRPNEWGTGQSLFADSLYEKIEFAYKLHGQTRRFKYTFIPQSDGGVKLEWGIERNLKWWSGSYTITPEALENGNSLSFIMPEDGNHVKLKENETFAMISRNAYRNLIKQGNFRYDGIDYKMFKKDIPSRFGNLIQVIDEEGTSLRILDNEKLPIILKMSGNPLEVDWEVKF